MPTHIAMSTNTPSTLPVTTPVSTGGPDGSVPLLGVTVTVGVSDGDHVGVGDADVDIEAVRVKEMECDRDTDGVPLIDDVKLCVNDSDCEMECVALTDCPTAGCCSMRLASRRLSGRGLGLLRSMLPFPFPPLPDDCDAGTRRSDAVIRVSIPSAVACAMRWETRSCESLHSNCCAPV